MHMYKRKGFHCSAKIILKSSYLIRLEDNLVPQLHGLENCPQENRMSFVPKSKDRKSAGMS